MNVLNLTLNKKWFDMIASGEKKEEYREIKPYWGARLLVKIKTPHGGYLSPWNDIENGDYSFKRWSEFVSPDMIFEKFDTVSANNGYQKNCPNIKWKHKGIRIGEGKPAWGAEPGKKYFVLEIGEITAISLPA